jgi:tetratricopeptide (TPR) repeat protein
MAMLAEILAQEFYNVMCDAAVLDRAETLVREALVLDPKHQHARWVAGWLHYLRYDSEPAKKELETAVALNPNHGNLVGGAAVLLGMMGQWERAIPLIHRSMRLNPHYPSWYHFVTFMHHYQLGDYSAALREASKIITPGFFFEPLSQAATYGQLGRKQEAKDALQKLVDVLPAFPVEGKGLLKVFVFLDKHVELLWDGLQKAGLQDSA